MKKTTKRISLAVLMLAVLFGAVAQAGCGAKSMNMESAMEMNTSSNGMSYASDDVYYEDAAVEEAEQEKGEVMPEVQTEGGAANENAGQTQKLILNIYIDMTVENPSAAMDAIIDYAASAGGYLLNSEDYYDEESNSGGARLTVRIPTGASAKMEEYLQSLGDINNSHTQAEDVTTQYYDLQSRIDQGELEVQTLEELLSQCTTVEEVLLVRDQLSRTQSDLESMKGQFRVLSELTSYDTVEISLSPVRSMVTVDDSNRLITGNEFLMGLSYGLQDSVYNAINGIANFVIFLAENLLQLVIFALVVLCIFLIIRRIVRKSRARKLQRYEAKRAAAQAQANAAEQKKE